MNNRKVEVRETRLDRVKVQVAARKKALEEKGLDTKLIQKDPMMRHLRAEARKVQRVIEALHWEPPKVEQAEKADKPAKAAAKPKAPKPPKEKKPKQEAEAPAD